MPIMGGLIRAIRDSLHAKSHYPTLTTYIRLLYPPFSEGTLYCYVRRFLADLAKVLDIHLR